MRWIRRPTLFPQKTQLCIFGTIKLQYNDWPMNSSPQTTTMGFKLDISEKHGHEYVACGYLKYIYLYNYFELHTY